MERNNKNLKRICLAMNMNDRDVHDVINRSDVSKNMVKNWLRNPNAIKRKTDQHGNPESVYLFRPMPDHLFDLFCENLADWLENDE